MRFAILGVLLAIVVWAGVTLVVSQSERTFELMDNSSARSLYSDRSSATALNWIDYRRRSFSCLFLRSSSVHHCGMNIQLGDGSLQGVDLEDYSTVRLAIDYRGPAETVRIAFRNAFRDPGLANDAKFHEIDIPIREGAFVYQVPLDSFKVAGWWLSQNQLHNSEYRYPERDNVIHFGLDMQTPLPLGQNYVEVLNFSVVAPRLTMVNGAWWAVGSVVYFVLIGLVYNFFRLRTQLKQRSEEMFGLLKKLEKVGTESAHFKRLSMYDPLTGLLNRRAALDLMKDFARHNSLSGTALVLMDIDHFKQVNDTYGHDVGDTVLRLVGATVQQRLREGDAAVRWGGEEIVVICPRTTSTGALRVAEKLRAEIKELRFGSLDLKISASFGVADIKPDETFDHAFAFADEALYNAKKEGRDRVCEYERDPVSGRYLHGR